MYNIYSYLKIKFIRFFDKIKIFETAFSLKKIYIDFLRVKIEIK